MVDEAGLDGGILGVDLGLESVNWFVEEGSDGDGSDEGVKVVAALEVVDDGVQFNEDRDLGGRVGWAELK